MYGLNLYLQALYLNTEDLKPSDKIRISITTLPEKYKQNFTIQASQMGNANLLFTVNVSEDTTSIIFVVRKKNFFKADPIIASTVIKSTNFPKSLNDTSNIEIKKFKLYEKTLKSQKIKPFEKRIVGEIRIQFSTTDAVEADNYYDMTRYRIKNGKGYSRVNQIGPKENVNWINEY